MIFSTELIMNMSIPSGSQLKPFSISLYPVAQEHFALEVPTGSQKCMQPPLFTSHLFTITEETKKKTHAHKTRRLLITYKPVQ